MNIFFIKHEHFKNLGNLLKIVSRKKEWEKENKNKKPDNTNRETIVSFWKKGENLVEPT